MLYTSGSSFSYSATNCFKDRKIANRLDRGRVPKVPPLQDPPSFSSHEGGGASTRIGLTTGHPNLRDRPFGVGNPIRAILVLGHREPDSKSSAEYTGSDLSASCRTLDSSVFRLVCNTVTGRPN